jgi:DtxR family Mn-dependent transcriptional regulator
MSMQCCELAHTEAVEDCLRAIFKLSGHSEKPTTTALADYLSVAPPTVSAMLKRLETGGLITRARGHAELTEHGARHALGVTRRHRLMEAFLAQVLEMPWDRVHTEADALEHAISHELEDRLDAFLGHPTHDPHGDPIPPATGQHVETWATPLAAAEPGSRFRVERVSDRDSDALRYLTDLGIRPGAVLEMIERAPFDGPLWVRVEGRRHALGPVLVQAVHGRGDS